MKINSYLLKSDTSCTPNKTKTLPTKCGFFPCSMKMCSMMMTKEHTQKINGNSPCIAQQTVMLMTDAYSSLYVFSFWVNFVSFFLVNFLCTFVKTFAQIWYVLYAVKYCKCTLSLLNHLECISILINNRQFTLNSLYLASVLNDANSKDVL